MERKTALFVVTSHSELGDTGKKTGYYLSEVTHPWDVLCGECDIDVVSPKGGKAPAEGVELDDPINRKYWENPDWQKIMGHTLAPAEVNPDIYDAIFYAGGHGVMWDFPDNRELAAICARIFDRGGIVAAVCHGPAGLLNVVAPNGENLIKNRKLTSFTNAEEGLIDMTKVVPFALQTALESKGCVFECEAPWSNFTIVDGRLITGQNPMSATDTGKHILQALKGKK